MRKLYALLAGVMLVFCATALAQTKEIAGKVTDAQSGLPLAGVTVKAKGAAKSTTSQDDGTFQLTVPEATTTIIFSYVGYEETELPVSNLMTVTMQPGNKSLSEVVVVGYGTKIKRDVTSAISRISAKDFQDQPLPSFEQALQGRASGVFINAGSGKLGQALEIRVRGIASISAGSQPLIVIDGVPVFNAPLGTDVEADNPLAALNPADIESMEVLKDAASSAIYGARGSNGVILVTTKSGKAGKTRLNINLSHGWSDPTHKREFMNAAQYKDLMGTSFKNAFGITDEELADFWNSQVAAPGLDEWNGGFDEKWSDRSFQKGYVTNYSVSMSGGDAKTKYLLSGGFNDQKGIILGNRLTRATGRLNLEHNVNNRLKLGANIGLFKTDNYRVQNDNAFSNPIQMNALAPIQPAYLPDGSLNRYTVYFNGLIDQEYTSNTGTGFKTLSSVFGELQLLPGLMLRSQAGIDYSNYQEEVYWGKETQDGAPTGEGFNGQSTSYIFTSTTTLNFNKQFNDNHSLDAVTGIEYIKSNFDNLSASGRNFPNSRFTKLASSSNIIGGSSSETGYTFASYFLRGNYKFKDKYLLGASMRVDGSSRFGRDNRYGFFPAVSAGWIVSDEDFLKHSNVLSFLKLRTSFGKTGNAEIGDFASLTLVTATPYGDQSGLWINQLGNNQLTWEKTNQFDVGIDFGIIDNRITGEIDYFHKNTKDLLLSQPLPAVNGFTIVTTNIGNMKNTGFEFVINSRNLIGEFKWNTSLNVSTYKNEITKLISPVAPGGRGVGRLEVGQPFGQFFGYKYMGVDESNGDALYLGKDGKTLVPWYNIAQDAGKFIIGDPNPDFYGGINNNFSYKGFDLDIQCQFVSGNDIFFAGGIYSSTNGQMLDNQTVDQANYWKEPGHKTDIPKPIFDVPNGSEISSRYVEDGSYFRVKSINFGYTLPAKWVSTLKLRNVRVYMAASNLFTITNYSGYDPEVSSGEYRKGGYTPVLATGLNPLINLGHDWYTAPQIKTISFGLNVGL
jgi:TonB-linked outer membrane protein, SusC/RagA family